MTVSVTLGVVVDDPVLLEATPLPSTPTMVNVYVAAGVTPLFVVVCVEVLLQAGVNVKAAISRKIEVIPQILRFRLSLQIIATNPKRGIPHHKA